MRRILSDEQKLQLYDVVRGAWADDVRPGSRGSGIRTLIRSRQRLVSFGWETILVAIITKVIIELIKYWMEQKDKDEEYEPPMACPGGFISEGVPEDEFSRFNLFSELGS